MTKRREHGSGSIYQRHETRYGCPPTVDGVRPDHTCKARWYGSLEAGWTADGKRRRITATGKNRTEVQRKLRDKKAAIDAGDTSGGNRITLKQWADRYLELRKQDLRPKAWTAAASPIRKWVVPTIGHKRLTDLTPGDVRKVAEAQYAAGLKTATAHATQRALTTMLNHAVREGYVVPQRVLKAPKPKVPKSDRTSLSVEETLRCLDAAEPLPHRLRWVLALVYGARQGEVLGLTEDAIDWDAGTLTLEWQLQALPYIDRKQKHLGFRGPRDYEVRQLVDAWHLVRPKTRAGHRVLALNDIMEQELRAWLLVRPVNPWGLLFPTVDGRPARDKADREEWWAIQGAAEVSHPTSPRPYHVHECRNFAATSMDEAGVSENIIMSTLGHASGNVSRRYMNANLAAKRTAADALTQRLGLGVVRGELG